MRKQNYWGIVGVLVGVITLCFTVYEFSKVSQLEFQILSTNNLIKDNQLDGLEGTYSMNGQMLENLWLVEVAIINSGDKDLTSFGSNSNLREEEFSFVFENSIKILQTAKDIKSNFPDDAYNLEVLKGNELRVSFDQWKVDEYLSFKLYITSTENGANIIPKAIGRRISSGEIIISDLRNRGRSRRPC
jgi:hypothetical protein